MDKSELFTLSRALVLFVLFVYTAGFTTVTPYDHTVMGSNGTFNDTECWCPCDDDYYFNGSLQTDQDLSRLVFALVNGLAIDKKTVSQTIRKKTSAKDDRPSAQGIGYVGVLVIISTFVTILLLDVQTLWTDFKRARLNIKKLFEESESTSVTYSRDGIPLETPPTDVINRPKIS